MSRPHTDAATSPASAALPLHRSYTRMAEALRNSMGEAGRTAVVARALACTKQAHPALTELRILGDESVRVDDIAASINAHGHENVAAAIDALIGAVLDILTRLIGADMAQQLIGDDAHQPQAPDRAREP